MKGPSWKWGLGVFFLQNYVNVMSKLKVKQNNCNQQVESRFILWQINCTKNKTKIFSIQVRLQSFYLWFELKVYKYGMNNHFLLLFLF